MNSTSRSISCSTARWISRAVKYISTLLQVARYTISSMPHFFARSWNRFRTNSSNVNFSRISSGAVLWLKPSMMISDTSSRLFIPCPCLEGIVSLINSDRPVQLTQDGVQRLRCRGRCNFNILIGMRCGHETDFVTGRGQIYAPF